jgi:hypothetical protein
VVGKGTRVAVAVAMGYLMKWRPGSPGSGTAKSE